jgi:hypothetical protein
VGGDLMADVPPSVRRAGHNRVVPAPGSTPSRSV